MRRWTILIAILALIALLVWTAVVQMPDGRLHVFFLDVESGQGVLIRTGSVTILIDGGPRPSYALTALGRYLPFWQRTIDLVVATHQGTSAVLPLLDVTERYEVRHVLAPPAGPRPTAVYMRWRAALASRRIPVTEAKPDTFLALPDGTVMHVLAVDDDGMTILAGSSGLAVLLAGASIPDTSLDIAMAAISGSRQRAALSLPDGIRAAVVFNGRRGTASLPDNFPPDMSIYSTATHGTVELIGHGGTASIRVRQR